MDHQYKYHNGFIRVAACSPDLRVADVEYNVERIKAQLEDCDYHGVYAAVFPELCITGYTCGDMFFNDALLQAARDGLNAIEDFVRDKTKNLQVAVVGLPLDVQPYGIMNVAAFICKERGIIGFTPKTYLPNYKEFYEGRQFVSGHVLGDSKEKYVSTNGGNAFLRNGMVYRDHYMKKTYGLDVAFGIEICEDLWTPIPPSSELALKGATIILNPSASNELVGKAEYRRNLVAQQSARCVAAYVYASAGPSESTTDVVYSGHSMIAYNGAIRREIIWRRSHGKPCSPRVFADVDVKRLVAQRRSESSFAAAASTVAPAPVNIGGYFSRGYETPKDIMQQAAGIYSHPFVPADMTWEKAKEILDIQARGLATRLNASKCARCVLGLSGGLDSTLAALVIYHCAMNIQVYGHKRPIHISMPGFGTSERTRNNARALSQALFGGFMEIDITDICKEQMKLLGVPEDDRSVTFENIQARTRTSILMNTANKEGGLVIGTGDLSELALGWCTYNADHMSMYNVNCSIPKTLVRSLVQATAEHYAAQVPGLMAVITDILDTPVSPELLPTDDKGNIAQKTEDTLGKYVFHDFFLYHFIKYGASKRKLREMAHIAFPIALDGAIEKALDVFMDRFPKNQFKRSCMPDGPKVGTISLSPRGDWRMPSDAVFDTINNY